MAIAEAGPHDAVLIAGRGHETTVRFGDLVVTLDDRQAALSNLRAAGYCGFSARRRLGRQPPAGPGSSPPDGRPGPPGRPGPAAGEPRAGCA